MKKSLLACAILAFATPLLVSAQATPLVVSLKSEPTFEYVVPGKTGHIVATVNLDATSSSADQSLRAISLNYIDGLKGGFIKGCVAYDGSIRLMSHFLAPSGDGEKTFVFDAPVVVPKGMIKKIEVRCDIPAGLSGAFRFRIVGPRTAQFSVTPLGSVDLTPPVVTSSIRGVSMRVRAGTRASQLKVTLDASSPAYKMVAGGTSNVTMSALRVTAETEAIALDRIALQLTSGSPNALNQVTLWDGTTQIGAAVFAGTSFATTTITQKVIIPPNAPKTITVKADLSAIGVGQPGMSGQLVKVDYDNGDSTGTRGIGQTTGLTINRTSTADTRSAGVRTYRSYPTIGTSPLPTGKLANGTMQLYAFYAQAERVGDAGIQKITAGVTVSPPSEVGGTVTVSNLKLYAYTASGVPVPGYTDGQVAPTLPAPVSGKAPFVMSFPLQIPAGQMYYFKIFGDVQIKSGSGTPSAYITVKLLPDTRATSTMLPYTSRLGNFAWSPNSTTTSTLAHADWTNGFGVPGLANLAGNTMVASADTGRNFAAAAVANLWQMLTGIFR